MSTTEVQSNRGLGTKPVAVQLSQPLAMISFMCPCCSERLNVSVELAGIAGPCPACAQMIRAPRSRSQSMISRKASVSTSEVVLPALDQRWRTASFTESPSKSVSPSSGIGAVKRINPLTAEGLDDSWREKVERERKLSRRRNLRDRWLENILTSRQGEKLQKIGIIVIAGILAVTIGALFLNHRSGGALFKRFLG